MFDDYDDERYADELCETCGQPYQCDEFVHEAAETEPFLYDDKPVLMCEFCDRCVSWVFIDAYWTVFICNTEECYIEAKEWSRGDILYAPLVIS